MAHSQDSKSDDKKSDEIVWTVRARRTLDDLLVLAIHKDTHSTKSEFIRQAVREKLKSMGIIFHMKDANASDEEKTKLDVMETKIEGFSKIG